MNSAWKIRFEIIQWTLSYCSLLFVCFCHFIYSYCYSMYVLFANKECIQRSTLSCETESSKVYLCKHVFMYWKAWNITSSPVSDLQNELKLLLNVRQQNIFPETSISVWKFNSNFKWFIKISTFSFKTEIYLVVLEDVSYKTLFFLFQII